MEVRQPKSRGRNSKRPGRRYPQVRRRVTYLPRDEAAVLRRHLATYVSAEPDALVFPNRSGKHMSLAHLSDRVWSKAVVEAFGPNHRFDGGLTRHAFRHLAATRWLNAGVRINLAVKWGGWLDASTFLKIYTHCLPADVDHGIECMLREGATPNEYRADLNPATAAWLR